MYASTHKTDVFEIKFSQHRQTTLIVFHGDKKCFPLNHFSDTKRSSSDKLTLFQSNFDEY